MKEKLKKITIGFLCIASILTGFFQVQAMEENMYYVNPRFGFSIEYQPVFTEVSESDNGDGITLTNKEKGIELKVYGSNNVLDTTAESLYKELLKEIKVPIIGFQEEDGYLVVWEKENDLVWAKVVVGKGSINGFQLSYPKSDQKIYEELVKTLIDTFRTPYIEEAR